MKDDVTPGDGLVDHVGIGDVSGDDFQLVEYLAIEEVQVVPIAGAVVMNEGTHAEAVTNKALHEVTSNEAGRTRDESRFPGPE
jgi:hypothetical protein